MGDMDDDDDHDDEGGDGEALADQQMTTVSRHAFGDSERTAFSISIIEVTQFFIKILCKKKKKTEVLEYKFLTLFIS